MHTTEIQRLIERRPFRPFSLRLNNGAQYAVNQEKQLGAPEDFHVVVYFGPKEVVLIDPDSIVEVMS